MPIFTVSSFTAVVVVTAIAVVLVMRVVRKMPKIIAKAQNPPQSPEMPEQHIDINKLEKVKAQVKEMDEQPLSLEILDRAIDLIADVLKVDLKKKVDETHGKILRIYRGNHHFNIHIKDGKYVDAHMALADMHTSYHESTSQLAWAIAGGYEFLPKHIAAAQRRVKKEGGDETSIPVSYIKEEAGQAAKQYAKQYVERMIKAVNHSQPGATGHNE